MSETPDQVNAKLEEIERTSLSGFYERAHTSWAADTIKWLILQLREEMRKNADSNELFKTLGESSVNLTEEFRRQLAEKESTNQRLADLVRYKRMELHADDLISNEEYAEIIQNPGAVNRLEGYDKVRAKLAEKESEITRLREALKNPKDICRCDSDYHDWICKKCYRCAALGKEIKTNG